MTRYFLPMAYSHMIFHSKKLLLILTWLWLRLDPSKNQLTRFSFKVHKITDESCLSFFFFFFFFFFMKFNWNRMRCPTDPHAQRSAGTWHHDDSLGSGRLAVDRCFDPEWIPCLRRHISRCRMAPHVFFLFRRVTHFDGLIVFYELR